MRMNENPWVGQQINFADKSCCGLTSWFDGKNLHCIRQIIIYAVVEYSKNCNTLCVPNYEKNPQEMSAKQLAIRALRQIYVDFPFSSSKCGHIKTKKGRCVKTFFSLMIKEYLVCIFSAWILQKFSYSQQESGDIWPLNF